MDEDPALHRIAFNAAFGVNEEIRADNFEMLKLLLRAGVDINQTDLKGHHAWMILEIQAKRLGIEFEAWDPDDPLRIDRFNKYINSPDSHHTDYVRVGMLLKSMAEAIDTFVKIRLIREVDKVNVYNTRGGSSQRLRIQNQEFFDLLGAVCRTSADIDLDKIVDTVNADMLDMARNFEERA